MTLFKKRGTGIMQGVTSVSIVPKYVLVSNLSFPLEIRQLLDWSIVARATAASTGASGFGMGNDMTGGKAAMVYSNLYEYFEQTMTASIVSLAPGSVQNYHFPVRGRSDGMLLQIRCQQALSSESSERGGPSSSAAAAAGRSGEATSGRAGGGRRSSNSTQIGSDGYVMDRDKTGGGGGQHAAAPWFGEVDITTLGVVYAKLRVPKLRLIKVQVEMVGASLTATFSEQSVRCPLH